MILSPFSAAQPDIVERIIRNGWTYAEEIYGNFGLKFASHLHRWYVRTCFFQSAVIYLGHFRFCASALEEEAPAGDTRFKDVVQLSVECTRGFKLGQLSRPARSPQEPHHLRIIV